MLPYLKTLHLRLVKEPDIEVEKPIQINSKEKFLLNGILLEKKRKKGGDHFEITNTC